MANEMKTGYIPRSYEDFPLGSVPYMVPFDIPLIPRDEWKDRIDHLDEHKASLLHVMEEHGIEASDQNGFGYCHTEDTEVLTSSGWVGWPEYDGKTALGTVNQNTQALEFQRPISRQILEYDGEMVYSSNRRIDFGVTPNHRMYLRKWDERARKLSKQYGFSTAENIGWYAGLMHAPSGFLGTEIVEVEIPGDRSYDGDDFLAMIAMVTSDGFAGGYDNPKTRNLVSFCCFDPKAYDKVAALASRLGFREQPSRKGVWNRWGAGALAEWIRANCYDGKPGASTKRVPDIVKWVSGRQITHFLTWYRDQVRKKSLSVFYTVSKGMVGDLQELLLRIGKRSTPSWQPKADTTIASTGQVSHGAHDLCNLVVSQTDRLCLDRKKHIEQDHYKGLVYCATVPNSTLVTRRNGSVLISGNCWAHGLCNSFRVVRAAAGLPHAALNAHALAAQVMNFRDRGGNNVDSIPWLTEHGCPTFDTWPGHSMDRSLATSKAVKEDSIRYRLTEHWELEPNNVDQMVTCVLNGIPVTSGWMDLGHMMSSVAIVHRTKNGRVEYGVDLLNSWGPASGDKGNGRMLRWGESKMQAFDQVAPRVSTSND